MVVGIVGGRGLDKTVFLGLLGATAINYAVEAKGHFRYFTTPEIAVVICNIVENLMSSKHYGKCPSELSPSLSEYRFWFGYSSTFTRALNRLYEDVESLNNFIKGLPRIEIGRGESFNIIEFNVYDISGEDIYIIRRLVHAAKEQGASVIDMMPENLRSLLDCDVLVMIIDASIVTTDINDPKYREMIMYDDLMATLISLVSVYKSIVYDVTRPRKLYKLYPVFVFTKFDAIDTKVLRALGISDNVHEWFARYGMNRRLIHEKLIDFMRKFFLHTTSTMYHVHLMGVELGRFETFASYLMTEFNPEEGMPVPKVVKAPDGVSHELVYSRSEYRRFIDYFGSIAGKIEKAQRLPENAVSCDLGYKLDK